MELTKIVYRIKNYHKSKTKKNPQKVKDKEHLYCPYNKWKVTV